MNIEKLLEKRYKVIENYPNSYFCVGQILGETFADEEWECADYPLLFKELKWHEERNINEMPEYLSVNGVIKKVKKYGYYKGGESAMFEDGSTNYLSHTLPTQPVSTK